MAKKQPETVTIEEVDPGEAEQLAHVSPRDVADIRGQLTTGLAMDRPLSPYNPSEDGQRRLATSLRPTTDADRLMAFRAATGQDVDAEDVLGKIHEVRHWLMHDCRRVNEETGELEQWVRTVLICEDGTRIATGSSQIIDSLMSLISFFGPAPWAPALKISIESAKSARKRTYYTLDVH